MRRDAVWIDTDAMISDRELWACAQQVLNHHGPDADAFIRDRLSALSASGDEAGTRIWLAIADRIDRLRDTEGQASLRN